MLGVDIKKHPVSLYKIVFGEGLVIVPKQNRFHLEKKYLYLVHFIRNLTDISRKTYSPIQQNIFSFHSLVKQSGKCYSIIYMNKGPSWN